MIRSEKRLRLCTALLLADLAFIWGNSLLPGEISGAISDWVFSLLAEFLPAAEEGAVQGSGLLRKLAHFTEFAALGICLGCLLGMLRKPLGFGFLSGLAAACVDETIQRFVPGRGPSVWDVGIDTCGVTVGMGMLLLGHYLMKRKHYISGGKQI